MSIAAHEDLQRYVFTKTDDPEIRARQRQLIEWGLETVPEAREKVKGEGRVEGHLEEARKMLRRVLKARGLTLLADDRRGSTRATSSIRSSAGRIRPPSLPARRTPCGSPPPQRCRWGRGEQG